MKTLRTMLYGDSEFSPLELELLHTPIMQRLYNLKQLGFTDKIYPDAIHSRFNHIIGVTIRAEKIVKGIIKSLRREKAGFPPNRVEFRYDDKKIGVDNLISYIGDRKSIVRLIALLHDIGHIPFGHTLEDELHIFKIKHDDPPRQVNFFNILIKEFTFSLILRHVPDYDKRLLEIVSSNEVTKDDKIELIGYFKICLQRIGEKYDKEKINLIKKFLLDLETSMKALLYLDALHGDYYNENALEKIEGALNNLMISELVKECEIDMENRQEKFNLYLDAFMLDVVGNTICADLLDYTKRDSKMSGLLYDYDERIFKYFNVVSHIPKEGNTLPSIRLALQIFTNKLRYDVVSEIVTILRTRYLLSERVLFHPTKCSAGAMLGTAVYMIGLDKAEIDFFRMGDAVFLKTLEVYADKLKSITCDVKAILEKGDKPDAEVISELFQYIRSDKTFDKAEVILTKLSNSFFTSINKNIMLLAFANVCNAEIVRMIPNLENSMFVDQEQINKVLNSVEKRLLSATQLLWEIRSRQFFKKVFRVAKIDTKVSIPNMRKLAEKFQDAKTRFLFERKIESNLNLEYGSLVMHCPKFDTTLKAANVLIFGSNPDNAIRLNQLSGQNNDHELSTLKPYIEETNNLQEAYKSIWNLYFFVQEAYLHRWPIIESEISRALKNELGVTVTNSDDLHFQLEREYFRIAEPHIKMIKYMESDECKTTIKITPEFAEFVESEVFRHKRKAIEPKEIITEWLKKTIDEEKKK